MVLRRRKRRRSWRRSSVTRGGLINPLAASSECDLCGGSWPEGCDTPETADCPLPSQAAPALFESQSQRECPRRACRGGGCPETTPLGPPLCTACTLSTLAERRREYLENNIANIKHVICLVVTFLKMSRSATKYINVRGVDVHV